MKMIPTYVLENHELYLTRRIAHLVGYVLEEPERVDMLDEAIEALPHPAMLDRLKVDHVGTS